MKKHDYYRENHLCFNYDYSNYLIHHCKYSFSSDWVSAKDDKIKLQSYKTWSKKHARIQILHASSFNNNDKSNHNVHIITDKDYKSDFNRSHKHSKN